MTPMLRIIGLVLLAATCAGTLNAHPLIPGKLPEQPVLLRNATLHTVTNGTLEQHDLLLAEGKILAIGQALQAPENSIEIDASDSHVYPGLIAMNTTLGLREISAVRATDDVREVGDFTPEIVGFSAFNADSEVVPTTRSNGITHAQVVPFGNRISGRSSLLDLDGWNAEKSLVQAQTGLHIRWPQTAVVKAWWKRESAQEQREEHNQTLAELLDWLEQAHAYYLAMQSELTIPRDLRFEAMMPAFGRELPVYVHADDQRQIAQALAVANQYGFRLIIVGGYEAHHLARELVDAAVPVVYTRSVGLPMRADDGYDQAFVNAARLAESGVTLALAFQKEGNWDARNLPFAVGMAISFGLDPELALRSTTLVPAQLMGVDTQLGSLEVGKSASLVVTKGDIFDYFGHPVQQMFIDGRPVDLDNRHTLLNRKYRQR